jgi:hypothetical protein
MALALPAFLSVVICSRANAGNPAPPDGRGYYGICWASENPEKTVSTVARGEKRDVGGPWGPRTNLFSFSDLRILRTMEGAAGYFGFPGEMKPCEIETKKDTGE